MRFVTMDDEGADLMEAGMEMAHAALSARARRIDPDGIISKSVGMSVIKCADILRGLRAPPAATLEQLSLEQYEMLLRAFTAFLEADDMRERGQIWEAIRAVAFTRGQEPKNESPASVENPEAPRTPRSKGGRKKPASRSPDL